MIRLYVRYHETLGPIIVQTAEREENARRVEIHGPSVLAFHPHAGHPRIWLETEAPITVVK